MGTGKLVWENEFDDEVQGLTFIPDNKLCIIQDTAVIVYEWDSITAEFRLLKQTEFDEHSLSGVAASPDGHSVYITCDEDGCATVHQYDLESGTFVENAQQWPKRLFKDPISIAVSHTGSIAVGDDDTSPPPVFIHNADGSRMFTLSDGIDEDSSVLWCAESANHMAFDGDGNVIIADWIDDCVYVFDGKLMKLLFTIRTAGDGGGDDIKLNSPKGVAVNDIGHIIVSDSVNGRLSEFSQKGTFLCHPLTSETSNIEDIGEISFAKINDKKLLAFVCEDDQVKIFQM